jgi:uncharacterized protein (TIGR03083 family)
MNTTVLNAAELTPISRSEAPGLATTEGDRMIAALHVLATDEWARPTECEGWDVRAMVSHVLGMAESQASMREFGRQFRKARRAKGDGAFIDAMTALQVREHARLTPNELVDRLTKIAPRAVRGRRRMPTPIRAVRMAQDPPFETEKWRLGYLMDIILTRDTWMHRVDIARATAHDLVLTPEHDGRLVADAVGEWARRHGQPFRLELSGPTGGTFAAGTGGPAIELDAVEFCRILSGRSHGDGLLATPVPF